MKLLNRTLHLALATALLGSLAGCGGGGAEKVVAQATDELDLVSRQRPASSDPSLGEDLLATSLFSEAIPLAEAETLRTSLAGPQLAFAHDSEDRLVGIAFDHPDFTGELEFSPESTAQALIFMASGVFSSDRAESRSRLQGIPSLGAFGELRDLLASQAGSNLATVLASEPVRAAVDAAVREFSDSRGIKLDRDLAGAVKFEATLGSGGQVNVRFENQGFRRVVIARQDFRGRTEQRQQVVDFKLPGAATASWGSIFTLSAGSAGAAGTDKIDMNPDTGATRSIYFIKGLGRDDGSETVSADTAEATTFTAFEYAVLPVLDMVLGIRSLMTAAEIQSLVSKIIAFPGGASSLNSLIESALKGDTRGIISSTIDLAKIGVEVISKDDVLWRSIVSRLSLTAGAKLAIKRVLTLIEVAMAGYNVTNFAIAMISLPASARVEVTSTGDLKVVVK